MLTYISLRVQLYYDFDLHIKPNTDFTSYQITANYCISFEPYFTGEIWKQFLNPLTEAVNLSYKTLNLNKSGRSVLGSRSRIAP